MLAKSCDSKYTLICSSETVAAVLVDLSLCACGVNFEVVCTLNRRLLNGLPQRVVFHQFGEVVHSVQ